jgi:hypothetical protein
MSTDVQAQIDTETAALARLVDAPDSATLGYGTDFSCVTDCDANFSEVDPNSALGIAQAAIRRLTCPRAGNPDDANYGLYLPGFLNHGTQTAELSALNGKIALELRKDDRVESLTVTTGIDTTARVMSVAVQIAPAVAGLNPFTFTFSVTDDTALLETIG